MKLAFDAACLPELDLSAVLQRAATWKFDGFELSALYGQPDLASTPLLGSLLRDPAASRAQLAAAGKEVAALDTGIHFGDSDRTLASRRGELLRRWIDLSVEIGCRTVIVGADPVAEARARARAIERTVEVLGAIAEEAAGRGVHVALENSGFLATSYDQWYLRDACSAALRVAWDSVSAYLATDTASIAIPRLAASLTLVRLGDMRPGKDGRGLEPVALGGGVVHNARVIELLKGVAYRGWLAARWPAPPHARVPDAEGLLARAGEWLNAERDKPVVVLSAYKGDPRAPRYAAPRPPTAEKSKT